MSSERPRPQPAPAFAGAVRDARERAGLDAVEFAARAGIEPPAYAAIERGESELELETIVQIAAALGISGSELLARAEL
jgi:transcriptional regulator with XRE-family HTH domain